MMNRNYSVGYPTVMPTQPPNAVQGVGSLFGGPLVAGHSAPVMHPRGTVRNAWGAPANTVRPIAPGHP